MSVLKENVRGERMKSRKRRERAMSIAAFAMLIVLLAVVLLPLWWIFRSSLMTNTEIYLYPPAFLPSRWLLSNYGDTLEYFKFWLYLGNTMTIIVPSMIAGSLPATLCGYAFARLRFRGKRFIFSLCIGSMLLPSMVTLIPLYVVWTRFLGLGNTYWPLILPYFCGGGAFNIFLIRQFIKTIPREMDEAAFIDGAGYMRILWSIIVPAIKPAMIVVALFLFITMWNDLLQQTLYIKRPENYTIAIGLGIFRSSLRSDWNMLMADLYLGAWSFWVVGLSFL